MLYVVDDTNLFISGLCANETVFIAAAKLESHNVRMVPIQSTNSESQ